MGLNAGTTLDHLPSRRQRILAAAEAEFAKHGFAGARVARIAEVADVNKQLLFHYFQSKTGLYEAVAESVATRATLEPPQGRTPGERLRATVEYLVRTAQGHRALLQDGWLTQAADLVASIIEDGQRSGHFRDDVDPQEIAEVVVAASFGNALRDHDKRRAGDWFAGSLAQLVMDHATWR